MTNLFKHYKRKSFIKNSIIELSNEIFKNILTKEEDNLEFKSSGIFDGKEIIEEYILYNEYGLAFDHLKYVINESGYKLNNEQRKVMNNIVMRINPKENKRVTTFAKVNLGCRGKK